MLALLAEEPMHCYHLRQRFEARTGGTWPLNIGQAYTTVQRLVRDGLVEPLPADGDTGTANDSKADDDGALSGQGAPQHVERYRLTDSGRAAVDSWWTTPVVRGTPSRDELAIKIALAVTAPGVDVRAIIQSQRTETMRALRDYTKLAADQGADLTWALVLDNLVFTTEAEVRWLDHVEARIARAASSSGSAPSSDTKEPRTTATSGTTATHGGTPTPNDAGPQGGPASPQDAVGAHRDGGAR